MTLDPTKHPLYATICSVSGAVLAAERDMDASITTLANLVTLTVAEFASAKLPARMAQKPLAKLGDAIQAHITSRQLLIEAHNEYGRAAALMEAGPEEWGPWWPCPKGELADVAPAKTPLRVAA